MEQLWAWAAAAFFALAGFCLGDYSFGRNALVLGLRQMAPEPPAEDPPGIPRWMSTVAAWGEPLGPRLAPLVRYPTTLHNLQRSGHLLTPEGFGGLKFMLALIAAGIAFCLAILGFVGGPGVLVLATAAFLWPDWWLSGYAARRQQEIAAALPDLLDLLSVTLQAGCGLIPALQIAADRCNGPLGEELRRTMEEMRLGRTLEAALSGLQSRVDSRDLEAVVQALRQGRQLGVSIASAFAVEAWALRRSRALRVREAAAIAGPKISLVATGLMVPAILLFLTGTIALNLWTYPETFGLGAFHIER